VQKLAIQVAHTNRAFGDRLVAELRASDLLPLLRVFEQNGHHETARRVRALCSRIFRFAVATGRCENDPAAVLTGALASPGRGGYSAITDREGRALEASPVVRALVGLESIDGLQLEASAADRLRREQARLEPVLAALGVASPPIGPEDIVSIHSFDTTLGPERLQALGTRMFQLVDGGQVPFNIQVEDANLTPGELSPAVSNFEFPDVGRVIAGTLDVIEPLGEGLRDAGLETKPRLAIELRY